MSGITGWEISVEEEYKRAPKLNPEEVQGILEWASKQPHLPEIPRHRVIMMLKACDFSLERTKETLDIHYTIKTRVPEVFGNLDVHSPWTQIVLKHLDMCVMPSKDDNDCFNLFYLFKPTEISEWKLEEYVKAVYMSGEISHLTMGSGSGYNFITDAKNFGLSHLLFTPLATVQRVIQFLQDGSHYAIKAMHYINAGTALEKLYQLIKPFIKKELMEMIHIHSGTETLFNYMDKKFVPSDYGGTGPPLKELHDKMCQSLEKKNDWFKSDCQLVVDESKRPATSKNRYDGIDGSFRKITID